MNEMPPEQKNQENDEVGRLLRFILANDGTVNLPYILRRFYHIRTNPSKNYNEYMRHYMRIYRKIKRLEEKKLLTTFTGDDSLLWISITPEGIDLIKREQNSNRINQTQDQNTFIPKRTRPERIDAILYCLNKKQLTEEDIEKLSEYYEIYLEYIDDRSIILKKIPDAPEELPPFLIIPYRTRFNDNGRIYDLIDKYEQIFSTASEKYQKAVFLTLTTDPKRHKSIYHSWKFFGKNFNRFMSWLRKRLGFRPPYIAVYEFTKSGLLHVHIILFGISYIAHKYIITEEWERTGQGKINYIYALKNNRGKWEWVREKPKDSKTSETAQDYLKKYLKKGLYDKKSLLFYWISNKRFFSYSRALLIGGKKYFQEVSFFEFFGSYKFMNIPYIVFEILEKWEAGELTTSKYNRSKRREEETEQLFHSTFLFQEADIIEDVEKKSINFFRKYLK